MTSTPLLHQLRTMTTTFITETVDQELQLTDLQQLNGAAAPISPRLGHGSSYRSDGDVAL